MSRVMSSWPNDTSYLTLRWKLLIPYERSWSTSFGAASYFDTAQCYNASRDLLIYLFPISMGFTYQCSVRLCRGERGGWGHAFKFAINNQTSTIVMQGQSTTTVRKHVVCATLVDLPIITSVKISMRFQSISNRKFCPKLKLTVQGNKPVSQVAPWSNLKIKPKWVRVKWKT